MTTITLELYLQDYVYLAVVDKDGSVFKAEIQTSDTFVGGNEGGYTNDSNIYFESAEQAQSYYERTFKQVFAFEDEYEAEEKCAELERCESKSA